MKKKYYSLETAEKTATVVIFGDITSEPYMESDVSSYELVQELEGLNVDKIDVHINSYGGEVSEALAIANTLMRHPAKVTTYVDGFACSGATIIFMAGDERIMSPFSNFLIHRALRSYQGNDEGFMREAENLKTITESSVKIYTDKTGRSRDEIVNLMSQERFLSPEETLEWGFATAIDDSLLETKAPTQSVRQLVYDRMRAPEENNYMMLFEKVNKMQETLDDLLRERQEAEIPKDQETTENNEPTASYMARFFNAMNS